MSGISAVGYGYICGGRKPTVATGGNMIQRHSHTSDSDSVDWANLTRTTEVPGTAQF